MKKIENKQLYNEKDGGIFFLASSLMPLIFSFVFFLVVMAVCTGDYAQADWFILMCFLIGQVALGFFIACYSFVKKRNPFKTLSFNKFNKKYIAVILLGSFGMIFGLGFVNTYFAQFLEFLGVSIEGTSPPLSSLTYLILSLVCIAVLPALCEEMVFRGYILKGMKNCNILTVVLINGFCFAIYHHNPTQTIYQFLNGCLFCLIAIKSCSILPSVIMHFLNNAFVLLFSYFLPTFEFSTSANIILIILGLVSLTVALFLIFKGDKQKVDHKEDSQKGKTAQHVCDKRGQLVNNKEQPFDYKTFFTVSAVGLIALILQFALVLI